jgi:hypothetical protein
MGAVTIVVAEHHEQKLLDTQHSALAGQINRLQAENTTLSRQVAQSLQSAAVAAEQLDELSRLNGEVNSLRDKTNDVAKLRQQNRDLLAKLSVPLSQISAEDRFTLEQTHVSDAINLILNGIEDYATNHSGQYPTVFPQATATNMGETVFRGGLTLEDFELLPQGTVDTRGKILILRNRVPIQDPGGNQFWVYGSLDDRGHPTQETMQEDFSIPR